MQDNAHNEDFASSLERLDESAGATIGGTDAGDSSHCAFLSLNAVITMFIGIEFLDIPEPLLAYIFVDEGAHEEANRDNFDSAVVEKVVLA